MTPELDPAVTRDEDPDVGPSSDHESVHSVRVVLPAHLKALAKVHGEVTVAVAGAVTIRAVLDIVEATYPMLRGTIREHGTLNRRPFVRYYACEQDLSHGSPDEPLPEAVVTGREPLLVVGAMAGG